MEIESSLKLNISDYQKNLNSATAATVQKIGEIQNSFNKIKGLFAGLITAGAIKGAITLAENFNNVSGTIKNATNNIEEFRAAQTKTFESAQRLGLQFEEMAGAVTALLPPMKTLGASTKTVQTFAETLQAGFKANALSGGAAVINALSKSLNKGIVDGKAFQQALLAIPDLAANIAKNLGKTEAEVKALGAAGKLTAEQFIKAVNASNSEYLSQAKNVNSLSNAFNVLKNSIAQYLSSANNVGGFTEKIGQAVRLFAGNIDKVVIAASALAGIKVAQILGGILSSIGGVVAGLAASAAAWRAETAAVMANTKAKTANAILNGAQKAGISATGLTSAGQAVAALAGAGAGLANTFKGIASILGRAGIIGLIAAAITVTGDWENAIASIKYVYEDISTIAKQAFNDIKDFLSNAFGGLKNFMAEKGIFSDFFNDIDNGILGVLETIGKLADNTVSGLKTIFSVLIQYVTNSVKVVYNVLTAPIKGVFVTIEKSLNKIINTYNKIAEKINTTKIDNVDFSGITDKLSLSIDFDNTDDIKNLFKTYQSEQKENGLQSYFSQMKQDIENSRKIAQESNKLQQSGVDNFAQFNSNFQSLNDEMSNKIKDLKDKETKSATNIQIEIEKLYTDTDFSKRDNDFYKKIDELQTALRNNTKDSVDWNAVAEKLSGINVSDRFDTSTPIPVDVGELIAKNNEQIVALQENTAAINSLNNVQAAEKKEPIIIKVIGQNIKELIDFSIDEKIARIVYENY